MILALMLLWGMPFNEIPAMLFATTCLMASVITFLPFDKPIAVGADAQDGDIARH